MKKEKEVRDKNMNFKVSQSMIDMANVLQEKHYINMSSFFRDSVTNLYNKLENKQEQ